MKRIIDYFVDNSVLVNLISLMIIVSGLFSIYSLNKEMFPNVDFDTITVRVNYPGSSAEDVEELVTISIERKLKDVDGIEEINALSGEGYSIVVLKVEPEYDIDEVLVDVRDAVENVEDLPEDAISPIIKKLNNSTRPLIKVALYGTDEWRLRELAKKLQDKLESFNDITRVDFSGYRDEIINVSADLEKLKDEEISLSEISNIIADRNINLSSGTIHSNKGDILVRTESKLEDHTDVANIVVRSNDSGENVLLKDIADVSKDLKEMTWEYRANKKKSIFLNVLAKSSADVINTSDKVKVAVENFVTQYKSENLGSFFMDEKAFFVKRRLSILTENGMQGMILVLLCLILFMNLRVSLVTSLGAPLAFLVSFACMDSIGVSINLISMFGLIMVLGMLVDDSIIVAEQFYQYLELGMKPKDAAKKAAYETFAPVTVTVLTTMVAFGALFYMGGIMGKFIWPIPAVIMICLAASWFECFLILPGHLADFVHIGKDKLNRKVWYQPLINTYEKSLRISLKMPKTVLLLFSLAFIGTLILVKSDLIRKELFPTDDVTQLNLFVTGKVGTPINVTNEVLKKAETIIFSELKKDELENLRTNVGYQSGGHGSNRTGSHYGSIIVYLSSQDFRDRSTDEIFSIIDSKVKTISKDFVFEIDKRRMGPPQGKPFNVELHGESLDELLMLAKEVQKYSAGIEGVLTSKIDFEEGKRQYVLKIKEKEARRLGVTNSAIALEVRRAFEGDSSTEIRRSDEDIEIIVRLARKFRENRSVLNDLSIKNAQGNLIKLNKVASFEDKPGAFVIRRLERKRTISVSGSIDKKKTSSFKVNRELETYMNDLLKDKIHLGYELSGENKDTADSMAGFKKAGVISMFLIFVILTLLFSENKVVNEDLPWFRRTLLKLYTPFSQPIIIMTAIPLGFIGVVLAFFALRLAIGFMAIMGMIGLLGVVINDSIVLVSFINKKIKESDDYFEAIVESCMKRFRPVILTTFTTVAGLLPVAHMPGGDPFVKPMATSFAYGLIFSTSLTLVFVPCSYLVSIKLIKWLSVEKKAI